MRAASILLAVPAALLLILVFQNCAGHNEISPGDLHSLSAPPVINGFPMALGPCAGNGQALPISGEYSAAAPLVLADKGVIWSAGKMQAVSNLSSGVYADRLTLTNLGSSSEIFFPGASYSPTNPQNYIMSAAVGLVDAGSYSLILGPQSTSSVTAKSITGAYYPLCGSSPVIALSRTEVNSAQSPVLTLDLNENATVLVAGEKTVANVPSQLSIAVTVTNADTNTAIPCVVQGTTAWNYPAGASTPSVSGYCQVELPPGHYKFSNVITSNAADLSGTQHLGFLAVRATAGERFSNF